MRLKLTTDPETGFPKVPAGYQLTVEPYREAGLVSLHDLNAGTIIDHQFTSAVTSWRYRMIARKLVRRNFVAS